jgi:hypothetical protein
MNTSAFIDAIHQKVTSNVFAQQYAQQRFGLTINESESLWNILSSNVLSNKIDIGSVPLSGEQGLPNEKYLVSNDLIAVQDLQKKLADIKPKRNIQEFSHYQMQIDIREFYLRFRSIQSVVESTTFSEDDRLASIRQLESLLKRSRELDLRFNKLFTGALYESEIDKLNQSRSKQARLLYEQLKRVR